MHVMRYYTSIRHICDEGIAYAAMHAPPKPKWYITAWFALRMKNVCLALRVRVYHAWLDSLTLARIICEPLVGSPYESVTISITTRRRFGIMDFFYYKNEKQKMRLKFNVCVCVWIDDCMPMEGKATQADPNEYFFFSFSFSDPFNQTQAIKFRIHVWWYDVGSLFLLSPSSIPCHNLCVLSFLSPFYSYWW